MDFQFDKQIAHLSLSNGHLFTSRSVELSEPSTISDSKYFFELELNCDPVCEQEFFSLKEIEYPLNTSVTASLLNFDFPNADLVEVERQDQTMSYCFSVTFSREHWQYKVSLHAFIPEFMHALNKSGLYAELEYEEEYGCYLQVKLTVPVASNLQNRIKTISRKLSSIQCQVLLEMTD